VQSNTQHLPVYDRRHPVEWFREFAQSQPDFWTRVMMERVAEDIERRLRVAHERG
jgi:hypothetical protein